MIARDIPHSTYLIVGGGMAADAAIHALLEEQPDADIRLLSEDDALPYARPPLTKDLWFDTEKTPADIHLHPDQYSRENVDVELSTRAVALDRGAHRVRDQRDREFSYDKMLLCTGGTPRMLPGETDGVVYYRSLRDYKTLQGKAALNQRIAVIGSGFIGSEIAAALSTHDSQVFMIFPTRGIAGRILPEGLSHKLNELYPDRGIDLLPEQRADRIERSGDHLVVHTEEGGRYAAESVVAGLGIEPNTGLAESAGLEVDDGILVDARLCTNDPDIYAAGDVARVHRKLTGRTDRVEHEMNALTMGDAAGRSMAGGNVSYDETPMFYSDLFNQGFEAVGELNPELDVYEDWVEPYEKGVVYYLDDRSVRGVLLWNVWDKVDQAKEWIAREEPVSPSELKGALTK